MRLSSNERYPTSRLRFIEACFLLVALALGLRLVQIQVLRHDEFLRLASMQWEKKVALPALRGNLFDRHGTPLAVSAESYQVSSDPLAWRDYSSAKRTAQLAELAELLAMRTRDLKRALQGDSRFALLRENVSLDPEQRERLQEMGDIQVQRSAHRIYPLGVLAASLIGQLNSEGQGTSGLEAGLQEELAGVPGLTIIQKDGLGRQIISSRNHVIVAPRQGDDVTLTLDHKVQAIVDAELARGAKEACAKAGSVVVLDPRTGDILALSSWPAPAARDGSYAAAEWKILPVQAIYEPGSTLKAITSIPLLEKGGIDFGTQEDAENGLAVIDGFRIRDDKAHFGYLSFRDAFILSSNICFAKFSSRISDEELFSSLQAAGFGNHYGIELPGEERGLLRRPGDWSRRSRMTLSFGQEMSATPLQMTAAFAGIANGGRLMKPRLVLSRWDRDEKQMHERSPISLRRICHTETSAQIRELLELTVSEGTGTRAAVSGLRIGGKTGTAQKFENGSVKPKGYLASFIGMLPLDEPALVIGVFLDEPDLAHSHGGAGAAPIFARIIEGLAVSTAYLSPGAELSVAWADEVGELNAPHFLDLAPEQAEALAISEDLALSFRGRGARVVSQEPAPGCRVRLGQTVALILGDQENRSESVPSLVGLSLRAARRLALERGYAVAPQGRGFVVRQGAPDPRSGGAIPLVMSHAAGRAGS